MIFAIPYYEDWRRIVGSLQLLPVAGTNLNEYHKNPGGVTQQLLRGVHHWLLHHVAPNILFPCVCVSTLGSSSWKKRWKFDQHQLHVWNFAVEHLWDLGFH